MERLPDPDIPIAELDDESKAWIDKYTIVDTLGIDGQSSDESDGDEDGVYNVKLLHWRSKELVKRLNKADRVRKTTNKYGNRRPGTKQRIRKRRSVRDSQEKVGKRFARDDVATTDRKADQLLQQGVVYVVDNTAKTRPRCRIRA